MEISICAEGLPMKFVRGIMMNGSEVKRLNFYSEILKKDSSLLAYIPKENENRPLPVLYFLHGRSGNEDILTQLEINKLSDKLIKENKMKPMIIVCPRIENSRGVNSSLECKAIKDKINPNITLNLGMYEEYFMKEVIPLVDNKLNTIKNRKNRFIGGISSGGYVALHYAFNHQNLFSKVGGHMPALELEFEEDTKPYFKDLETWEKYNPIHIARKNHISDIKVYLDAGDEDEGEFYEGCEILYKILCDKNVKCENHIFKGHHNGEYIKSNLEKYLQFYSPSNF